MESISGTKKLGQEVFDHELKRTLDLLKETLLIKAKEYCRNDNPFHNFEAGSRIANLSAIRALDGMLLKHYVSYRDMMDDMDKDIKIPSALIEEKLNYILVYFRLQKIQILYHNGYI